MFAGGTSPNAKFRSAPVARAPSALARSFPDALFEVDADALPAGLDPARHVVFSTLHGTFGEDGGMQRLLDAAGIHYAGCDAASSALTMDKTRTKQAVAARGVRVATGIAFAADEKPSADEIIAAARRATSW